MQLCYSTGTTYVYPLAWSFALAHEAGLVHVELGLGPEALWRGPRAVEQLARRHHVTISSIHGPILPTPGWSYGATNIRDLVAYGAAFQRKPLLVAHVPSAIALENDPDGQRFLDELAQWRALPPEASCPLALETPGLFHHKEHAFELFDIEALAAFVAQAGTQLVLDTVHVASLGYQIEDAYAKLAPFTTNVHLSDWRSISPRLDRLRFLHTYLKHHQPPGSGELPLERLLTTMAADRYNGLITLELSPIALRIWSPDQALAQLRHSVNYVQSIWERTADDDQATSSTSSPATSTFTPSVVDASSTTTGG